MQINRNIICSASLILASLILGGNECYAQKRKAKVVKKVVKKETNPIYESMLGSTAKIVFIDSIVVDKHDFLKAIPLSKELGTIEGDGCIMSHTNEFDNHRIFTSGDSINGYHLYVADKVGKEWSKPRKVLADDSEFTDNSYPFLMSDGITILFSAKSKKAIGGFDIFMTRYNTSEGTFYEPENYGLPFNSTGNDYFLAIDDLNSLGWLVTDRRQPEGKVCVYTFVPTTTREGYSGEEITDKELKGFADISSIRSTWRFGNQPAAIKRLANLKKHNSEKNTAANDINFVINDNIVYHSVADFRQGINRAKYNEIVSLKKENYNLSAELENLRNAYHNASNKKALSTRILSCERRLSANRAKIKTLEKEIRKGETL